MTQRRGRDTFKVFSPFINTLVIIFSMLPNYVKVSLLNHFRNTNGKFGLLLRYILIKSTIRKCGANVSVHPGVYLLSILNLSVGDNVSIHPMCYIDASGKIEIGSNVSIAHNTTILSSEHVYSDKSIPIKDQDIKYSKTIIKSDVWIGAGSRILAGSTINEGAIIAAGSVIKNSVESFSIYGGIPGRKIKER